MVSNTSAFLTILAIRAFVGRNSPLPRSLIGRFFACLTMLESLANLESLVGDVYLETEHELLSMGATNARIDHVVNDDHCETVARFFKK